MGSFLTGGGTGRVHKPVTPASQLRIQSSINGTAIPFLHGQQRLAINLLWYDNFQATAQSASSSGGKGVGGGGGGKGSAGTTGYTYTVDFIGGVSEGPIDQICGAWNNKTAWGLGALGLKPYDGAQGQAPPPFMTSAFPQAALGYSSLAYVLADPIQLGTSPELPNLNLEVRGAISGAVSETYVVASPYTYAASGFSLATSVTEQVTVPAVAPFQVLAQTPFAPNTLLVVTGEISSGNIPGSTSAGAIYTETGAPLTRVAANPAVGQFTMAGGLYVFAAADAGADITLIDLALGPGVNYAYQPTGTLTAGSTAVTGLSATTGLAAGQLVTGAGIAPGAVVNAVSGGLGITGTTQAGSQIVGDLSSTVGVAPGCGISDSGDAIPAGTTITAVAGVGVELSQAATATAAGDTLTFAIQQVGSVSSADYGATTIVLDNANGVTAGQLVTDAQGFLPANTTVIAIAGNLVSLSYPTLGDTSSDTFYFVVATATADLIAEEAVAADLSSLSGVTAGLMVTDSAGVLPAGTTVTGITSASLTLSAAATASIIGDSFTVPSSLTLSQPATASGTAVTLTFYGAAFIQKLIPLGDDDGAQELDAGEFAVSVQAPGSFGQYTFSAQDVGRIVVITDVPDADPSASLVDFLSNPRYGCGFPAGNIGDLSQLQDYAYAVGLFISPAVAASQAANQYLEDFSTGLNGEFVWSAGLLSFVPYGDQVISGNGRTYTPQLEPYYSLGEDDYLPNEGTASIGVSSFTSDDPVVCVRKRPSDALNDVKIEYLDRGNAYNPAIVEAKDDAAINLFGLKPADTQQLHFFCVEAAAIASANLQLGRQQIRNQYSFTVPWYFILLDPMDIIAISDDALGLDDQLVRILEILENQADWSLTLTVEEVLDGSGTTPLYGSQPKAGYLPNYNVAPNAAATPILFEPPPAIATSGGLEIWLLTGWPAGGGGCTVWVSSDGDTYKTVGEIIGGSRVGATTADFPATGDPDTSDSLPVQLATAGQLLSGTQSDADQAQTLCYVGGYAAPVAPVLAAIAGGSLAAADYYVRVSYVFPGGEGPPSAEEMLPVAAGSLLTVASPNMQSGATGWNVYVGTSSGGETRQNAGALAIGTGWVEPGSGLVAGGRPPDSEIDYELISYEEAELVGAGAYTLGSYIRRGQYGSTISDHPAGSLFARLDGTQLVIAYDKSQIGQTIFVKLTSFNAWGGGEQDLSEVQPYAHLIEGPPLPGSVAGFSVQQVGGAVTFRWSDLADAGMSLKGYDLLYGLPGGSVANATLLTQASRSTEMTNATVPPGSWIFYIRGHDIADQLGAATSLAFTVTTENLDIAAQADSPGWLGLYPQPGSFGTFVVGTSLLG